MTRIRFDPSFVEHERWERLGVEAFALHMAAVSYTTRTLSDGVLSAARVRVLTPLVGDPVQEADRLVSDGLWERLEDGQVRVCQVRDDLRHADGRGDEQPSRAFVERERDRARTAKETWRKRNADRNAVPSEVPNGAQASADQSSAVQDAKRPSPAPHLTAGIAAHGSSNADRQRIQADPRVRALCASPEAQSAVAAAFRAMHPERWSVLAILAEARQQLADDPDAWKAS